MPLGHGATPREIARAVQFILDSPSMTGQMIALDGGEHLGWQVPGQRLPAARIAPNPHRNLVKLLACSRRFSSPAE